MKIPKIFLVVVLTTSTLFFSCKPKDSDIQAKIEDKLKSMPGISVTVTDGVATLSGECKDDAAKDEVTASAKDVKGVKSVVNNCTVTPPPPPPAPVVINPDATLIQGVTDATKDFPDVKADVNNGVVTLTGTIKRSDLKTLMMSLNTLKPKKIDNKLTIK
ncbi:MAG TPA: BON domain-containing protein [Ginsengibacter sp.]|nr:BON domain-containing protein [Ginsengibacter sp.]